MKFELFGWELEIKKKKKRNITPKEPKPRNEFDEVLKPFLDRMNAEHWKMEIGEHVLCFKEIEIWISNKFYAYGNVWGTRQDKKPSLKNKWLLYRVVLRHEKLRKKMIRRI